MTLILGLETSCDETAAAVVADGLTVRSNVIASQHRLHEKFGGVVPEIASRAHLERLHPTVTEALEIAKVTLADIDAVAVGNRPGLIGSLLVGVAAAKALAWSMNKPLIGVDHVRAHLYAGLMQAPAAAPQASPPPPATTTLSTDDPIHPGNREALFPALGLVVSGGHTSLYLLESPLAMTLLGRTIDDAVGEAYDKAAVILDLGYPGGPKLDKLARTVPDKAIPHEYRLPRTMLGSDSLDFSFSGLKTALLYKVRGYPVGRGEAAHFERSAADLTDLHKAQLAAAFQAAAVQTLLQKIQRALDLLASRGTPARSLLIGGGVSANSRLREEALSLGRSLGLVVKLPAMSLCLDNAAMIAGLAYEQLQRGLLADLTLPALATSDLRQG